ncbi:MAG: Methionyl-tRNA formyltransferase [Candidatus Parcubacteria bacterium]|nr:Methionyl-tRNA formyltransferase [Candidatus Parcubacteria bacterium]
MNPPSPIRFAYFGSSRLSVIILDELEKAGFLPALAITTPDKPKGRHLTLTQNPVKEWALTRNIPVHDPAKLDSAPGSAFAEMLRAAKCDVFIVASYSKIIPASIIEIPARKTLNVHPSLLPLYRGPAPLQAVMLDDAKNTGVTIMRIDEKVDHGPIVAQKEVAVEEWPAYEEFEELMAREGAHLLAEILPGWVAGSIQEKEQDHSRATFTKKIAKEDGLMDIADASPASQRKNFLKIQAYRQWPVAYFMFEHSGKKIKVKVTRALFLDDKLVIERVIPEGKKEMSYADFQNGFIGSGQSPE